MAKIFSSKQCCSCGRSSPKTDIGFSVLGTKGDDLIQVFCSSKDGNIFWSSQDSNIYVDMLINNFIKEFPIEMPEREVHFIDRKSVV